MSYVLTDLLYKKYNYARITYTMSFVHIHIFAFLAQVGPLQLFESPLPFQLNHDMVQQI